MIASEPTENLRRLHERLRSGICLVAELEERLHQRDAEALKLESFDRVVAYLHGVVLPHLRGELQVLYPEAELASGIDPALIHRLISNCEQLECCAERVVRDRERVRRGGRDNVGYRRHITCVVRLLRRHLESVETELLPEVASRLDGDQVLRLYEEIEASSFEAELELSGLTVSPCDN
ncbi:MAG TPA: hemerythrin domain-containing protein [Candidatus Binatia bacterium]|nr:hemerythrin domain-containing protein [Candidatus Binatia bacterium]